MPTLYHNINYEKPTNRLTEIGKTSGLNSDRRSLLLRRLTPDLLLVSPQTNVNLLVQLDSPLTSRHEVGGLVKIPLGRRDDDELVHIVICYLFYQSLPEALIMLKDRA